MSNAFTSVLADASATGHLGLRLLELVEAVICPVDLAEAVLGGVLDIRLQRDDVGIDPGDCTLRLDQLQQLLSPRTRLVALGCASNAVGTVNPVQRLTAQAHAVGALVYLVVIRFAMRARANVGMAQIFATFGLGILMRGLAQYFLTPDYRSIQGSWLGGKTLSIAGIFLPAPQLAGALISMAAFLALYLVINRTDFGRALEATREDAGAVALVGIDKNRVFALGWGLAAGCTAVAAGG